MKDWVCRIDVRRKFGTKTEQVQAALSVGVDYLRDNPREQVEIFFRRGIFFLDSGDKAVLSLRNIRPKKKGRLILAGEGE